MTTHLLTAWLQKDNDVWVALCPELDVASEGVTMEEAKASLRQAVELFLESADEAEIGLRLHGGIHVCPLGVTVSARDQSELQ